MYPDGNGSITGSCLGAGRVLTCICEQSLLTEHKHTFSEVLLKHCCEPFKNCDLFIYFYAFFKFLEVLASRSCSFSTGVLPFPL